MAEISMGECRWRMLRRVLRKKRFQFPDCRNFARHDQVHFDWLVEKGFFAEAGDGWYEVSDKGKAAADLGYYEV